MSEQRHKEKQTSEKNTSINLMICKIRDIFVSEEGQAMTEYGLIVAVIAMGIVLALVSLQIQISELISGVSDMVSGAAASLRPTVP